jgi:hypothetical protein
MKGYHCSECKQGLRHRECAGGVHVGSNEREACPLRAGVQGPERAIDVNLCAGSKSASLRPDENIGEVGTEPGFKVLPSRWVVERTFGG